MNKPNVNKYFKMATRVIKKRSPEILTGLGIAGMVTTTVLAVKATPKALTLIQDAEIEKVDEQVKEGKGPDELDEKLTPVEVVKVAWKPYIPAVLLGTASAACLIGANSVHARRHAALYSAYKLSETALTEYKDKVKEIVPEKKVKEIKQKLADDKVDKVAKKDSENKDSKPRVIVSNDGDTWFVDPFTNEPFLSTTAKVDAAINKVNRQMMDEMFASLSDLYDELGIDHTVNSDDIGWCIDDGLIESDFSDAIVRNGKAYVVMDFLKRPEYGFDDKSKYYG
jgi:hypothetical protein